MDRNDLIDRTALLRKWDEKFFAMGGDRLGPNGDEIMWYLNSLLDEIKNAPTVEPFERIGAICNENCGYNTQGEWILVGERLPERYKEVIVTDIETKDTYCSWYHGNGYWECDNGVLKNRIIAWKPLPEPYKKGGEEE